MSAQYPTNWEGAVNWLRAQPDQQELVRACYFDDPLSEAAERFYLSGEWRETRRILPHLPGRALEIGSGRGVAAYALAKDGWKVSALEPDGSNLVGTGAIKSLCLDTNCDIEIVNEWGESLPFPDGAFDLVFCRQVLHHARDLEGLCREIRRVLKSKGTLVATREHVISRHEDLKAFLDSHPLQHLYGGEHAFLLDEYHSAIKNAGMALKQSLNPLASSINLFPGTLDEHRKLLAARLRVPPALIGNAILRWYGAFLDTPGRLYSFVAEKP